MSGVMDYWLPKETLSMALKKEMPTTKKPFMLKGTISLKALGACEYEMNSIQLLSKWTLLFLYLIN